MRSVRRLSVAARLVAIAGIAGLAFEEYAVAILVGSVVTAAVVAAASRPENAGQELCGCRRHLRV